MPETIEEDEKKDLGHGSSAEEVQKEEISPVKSPVRRGRKPKTETSETKPKEAEEESAEKKQRRSVGTPSVERPARERKAVERYAALSPRRVTPSKIPPIEQGPGTKLRDIPNVSFKLSKRKVDENLQALHTILFGRKANAHYLKRNISQFSGFVWTSDEEKQKTKVKEKLDKCNKDRLLDFCELLDVCTVKGTTKKEEISVKLMEFLESPYVSRDVVLADKEKAKKRKRRRKGLPETVSGEASSDGDEKPEGKKELTQSAKSDKDDDSVSSEAKDAPTDEHNSDSEHNQREDEEAQEDSAPNEKKRKTGDSVKTKEKSSLGKKGHKSEKGSGKSSSKDRSKASDEQKESSSKGATPRPLKKKRKAAPDEDSMEAPADSNDTDPPAAKPKVEMKSKVRQKKNKKGAEQMAANAKKSGSGSNVSSKGKVKAKASSGEDGGPTKEELREVVSEILKEVDFSTATLADILRQLGDHFDKNLMDRKAEVKAIIEEVISNMSDDEEVDEGDDEEGPEGEGSDGEDDD
ncbi:protein DEK protein [Dioscorea alata]|uniref:Protein DEK protein n=2 Tax=Dioscorea alata TaxID=55571 RepID=A0ACB7W778_DIOAL|nr:protein DEK protein [Dioscorea alata]KAH7683256.1 protein DEK protein [Dioscorea alata]